MYLNIIDHVVNKETNPAGEAEEEGEDEEKHGDAGEDEVQDEEQEVLTVAVRITHSPHCCSLLAQQRKHVLPTSSELVWSALHHKQQQKLYSRLEGREEETVMTSKHKHKQNSYREGGKNWIQKLSSLSQV